MTTSAEPFTIPVVDPADLRAWLAALPPGTTFMNRAMRSCPLAEFFRVAYGLSVRILGLRVIIRDDDRYLLAERATTLMERAFILVVDMLHQEERLWVGDAWLAYKSMPVTPAECLAVLDALLA